MKSIKRMLSVVVLFSALFGISSIAGATTLDFNTPPPDPNFPNYGGFYWEYKYMDTSTIPEADRNGLYYGAVSAPGVLYTSGQSGTVGWMIYPETFTLNSLYLNGVWKDGMTIHFGGEDWKGLFHETTVTLGMSNGSPIKITLNYENIYKCYIYATGGTPHGYSGDPGSGTAQLAFTMDDFTYNETVPHYVVDNEQTLLPGTTGDLQTTVDVAATTGTLHINSGSTLVAPQINNQGTITAAGIIQGYVNNQGTITNSGTIQGNVNNQGTLNAAGTIQGAMNNSGTLALTNDLDITGNLVSTGDIVLDARLVVVGNATMAGTQVCYGTVTLPPPRPGRHDAPIDVTQTLNISAATFVLPAAGEGQQQVLLAHADSIVGVSSATATSGWRLVVRPGGSDLLYAETVPIPATVWIFGSALAGLLGIRRRFRGDL